jgi:hypothetical protein
MNRLRIVTVLALVVVLGCLAFAFFSDREPRDQGRTLCDWIENAQPQFYAHGSRETNLVWQNSRQAVKQMAPGAIPFLLKWIQAKDSPLKTHLTLWLRQHPFLHLRITDDDQLHKRAMIGFALLENGGKPAWPTLSQWTESPDPERRFWAFDCLIESQADKETLLPVLKRLSHDPDTLIHDYAARQFRQRYPEEASAAGIANPPPSRQIFSSRFSFSTVRRATNQIQMNR